MKIQDIAKLAGVSKSTVSRVLNNANNVKDGTREHVLRIIKEFNYSPSAIAQGMPRQNSKVIGVIIPEPDNSFFGKEILGIENKLEELNLNLNIIVSHTHNSPKKELRALNMLRQQRVKGLILTTSIEYLERNEFLEMKKQLDEFIAPIVLFDRKVPNSNIDGVYFDNENSAYKATELLITNGSRRIGAIIGDLKLTLGRERAMGFNRAMEKYNLPIQENFLQIDDYPITTEKAYELTRIMIESDNCPDAVFLSNNLVADGFLKAISEMGLRLGYDLCCIGLDRSYASDLLNVNYSFIDKNPMLMGKLDIELLIKRFHEHAIPKIEKMQYGIMTINGSEKRIL